MSSVYDPVLRMKKLVRDYSLEAFVETGCYEGEALEYAASQGLNLYSCDINPTYAARCEKRFPRAIISWDDSVSFLCTMLPQVHERSFFWLDAHFPKLYHVEASAEFKFPLFDELLAIKEHKPLYQYDVICCDDIRCISDPVNPFFDLNLGEYVVSDHSLAEYKAILIDTHTWYLLGAGEGILLFVPRE